MDKRVFDSNFKRMAIDLSYAKGSVKEKLLQPEKETLGTGVPDPLPS